MTIIILDRHQIFSTLIWKFEINFMLSSNMRIRSIHLSYQSFQVTGIMMSGRTSMTSISLTFRHNIFAPGPNYQTRAFASLWEDMIPEYEAHTFERGGYFAVEVVPNKLAVLSLNTLYWCVPLISILTTGSEATLLLMAVIANPSQAINNSNGYGSTLPGFS